MFSRSRTTEFQTSEQRTSRSSRPRSSTPCNLVNIQYYVAATLPGVLSRVPIDCLLFRPHNFQQKKSWKKDRNFESKWQNFRRSNGSIGWIFYFPTDIFLNVRSWRWMWQLLFDSTNNSSPLQILGFRQYFRNSVFLVGFSAKSALHVRVVCIHVHVNNFLHVLFL